MVRMLVRSACVSVPALFLYGCGGGADSVTTTTGPADSTTTIGTTTAAPAGQCTDKDSPIPQDSCCCMTCGGNLGQTKHEFAVVNKTGCMQLGGQCTSGSLSLYQRPPPAQHAGDLCAKNGENDRQRHLIGGSPTSVQVVFLGAGLEPTVQLQVVGKTHVKTFTGQSNVYSIFQLPGHGWNGYAPSDRGDEYIDCEGKYGANYMNASCYYTSEEIHRIDMTDLVAGTRYQYKINGDDEWIEFKTPPALGSPITIGFTADLGQTVDSKRTMEHMQKFVNESKIDAVVFAGDLSYADGAADYWDTYGRLGDFLWRSIPTAYGVGNHEYTNGPENFHAFLPRYSWPFNSTEESSSPLWFSYDTGYAHVVMLCSYCDISKGGEQHLWLVNDLNSVNRTQTPWVVAAWHTPWYTSNTNHDMVEGTPMRESFEAEFYEKVDFCISGHVHAYERTGHIYKNETNACGPVYITIGDGGNHEGPACGWNMDMPWSEKREFSFGFGTLTIMNDSSANWSWYRNQDDLIQHDTVIITRQSSSLSECKSLPSLTV